MSAGPLGPRPVSRGTVVGIAVGAVLGLTAFRFGFGAVLVVGLLMLVGGFVGRVLDGTINRRNLADVLRGRTRGDL